MDTYVVCNQDGKVVSLLKDDLLLFSSKNTTIYDIIDKDSSEKLSNFLASVLEQIPSSNWEINVIFNGKPIILFFSGNFWIEYIIVRISREKIQKLFEISSPQNQTINKNQDILKIEKSDIFNTQIQPEQERLDQFTSLNNELVVIQRELSQKNIQLATLNDELEILATIDSLTGVYNRRAIINYAKTELIRAIREGRKFGLAILDIDHFKEINDRYGHQTGDIALKLFAKCLDESMRGYDKAGRLGGDEFFIYMAIDSKAEFKNILERILAKINKIEISLPDGSAAHLQTSIGALFYPQDAITGEKIDDLINKADEALYHVKRTGRNQIGFYDQGKVISS